MTERTVILSDLHLGRPHSAARSADALRPLWAGASRLILNGDVVEVHHPDHWSDAARSLLRLHDMTEEDAVKLVLLSGNHDPYLSERRHLLLGHGSILVTHGDALHPSVAPWSPAHERLRTAHAAALAAMDTDQSARGALEARLAASQHASLAEWTDEEAVRAEANRGTIAGMLLRPWMPLLVLRYWAVFPRLAAQFLEEHVPDARFIVIGHSHRAGIWHFGERTVINTGCYGFPGHPRAVILEGNTLEVRRVQRDGERYVLADRPLAEFTLDLADADDATSPLTLPTPTPGPTAESTADPTTRSIAS